MVKMTTVSIWTENDRLCGRCGTQVARADDWLCQGCRLSLEERWLQLTNSSYLSVGRTARQEAAEPLAHLSAGD